MKRVALLIGNSSSLVGVIKDLHDWHHFLTSSIGGAWNQDEIILLKNPSKFDLLNCIKGIRGKFDFAIIVYTGHGGYDRETIFEINGKGETINETDLLDIAPKQISVFDCCRVGNDTPLNESLRSFSMGGILHNKEYVRAVYEKRIEQAINQQIRLYACCIGETAEDTKDGALYIQNLLFSARRPPNLKKKYEMFNTVEDVHCRARFLTLIKSNFKQNPSAALPKCLSHQKLILSINLDNI